MNVTQKIFKNEFIVLIDFFYSNGNEFLISRIMEMELFLKKDVLRRWLMLVDMNLTETNFLGMKLRSITSS